MAFDECRAVFFSVAGFGCSHICILLCLRSSVLYTPIEAEKLALSSFVFACASGNEEVYYTY
jgi:hypothetical protein